MTYLIIIRGPLGIGKSTMSKLLAKKINVEYLSIDKVLENNKLDKIKGECIPLKNFIEANNIVLPILKEKLKMKSVIIDGNFYHKEQIEHLTKEVKNKCLVFTLKAPLETCIERDKLRKNSYGKDAAKEVHNLVSRFDYGIIIDTDKKTEEQVVEEILSYTSN
jgi:tRNA uridine 5-carbamoylmethylation protein Kti12